MGPAQLAALAVTRLRAAALLSLILAPAARAAQPKPFFRMDDKGISRALEKIHERSAALGDLVGDVSERFLGTPYELGPLGEGDQGDFDRDPLVSFKKVDCTTFVEEVMALSLEKDLGAALKTLQKIRYKGGSVSYEDRNHFPETDWLPNNISAGYLKDITRDVAGDKTREVHKLISKRDWYASMTTDSLKGFPSETAAELERRLKRLQASGQGYADEVSTVPYVPIEDFSAVEDKIPSGTIGSVVREDLKDKPVVVTHQLLLIRKKGGLVVRHAASGDKVVDVPADEYLKRCAAFSWKVLGLNLTSLQAP